MLRQLPNLISAFRIVLVAPVAWCLGHLELGATLALVAVAGASDGLDGFIARRFGWQSRLGAILDPAADKLLLVTLFLILALLHRLPVWLAVAVLTREAVLLAGAIVYRLCFGPLDIRPSAISKLNTLFELIFVLGVIGHAAFGEPPPALLTGAGAITFVTVVVSGIDYVLRYAQLALGTARAGGELAGVPGSKLT